MPWWSILLIVLAVKIVKNVILYSIVQIANVLVCVRKCKIAMVVRIVIDVMIALIV